MRLRAAGDMNFAEGTLWSEGGAGTNAIGTAIALDHAVQVFGPEHFSDPVQRWTCSAAPIHDPDTGAVIGVIDLTGDLAHRAPAQPRRRHRDRARRRGQPPARAAGARRAPARALRRPRRRPTARADDAVRAARSAASRAGWGVAGRLAIPPGGGSLVLPSGAAAVAEPVSPTLEAFVVHAVESRRVTSDLPPAGSSSASSAATARRSRSTAARPSCARGWPRSSRCCARTRTG